MIENEKINNQKNSKKVVVIVLVCILVLLLIGAGIYGYFYKKSSDEVKEIKGIINESFKDLDVEFQLEDEITCEDLILQLIEQENIPDNTNITLEIDGKKLSDGETIVFDHTGKYYIKLTVTTESEYQLSTNSKSIQNEKIIEVNVK